MNRTDQKRLARYARTARVRHDRLITEYMKNKYPDEYKEAEQFYQSLDRKYQNKRDLTKTTDFLHLTTGYHTFVELYRARAEETRKQKISQETHATGDTTSVTGDTMSLEIQLMSNDDINNAILNESLCIPEDTYNTLIDELAKDPQLYDMFNDILDTRPQPQQLVQTTQDFTSSPQHQQEVDEIIHQLGLTQDRQTDVIVQSPMSQQVDEILNELDDILPELMEQTPLEEELEQLGY